MRYIVFDSASGRIKRIYSLSRPRTISCAPDELVMIAPNEADFLTHYIDIESALVSERTQFTATFDKAQINATGEDYAALNVPAHSVVTWPDGEVTQVDDGLIEFATDLPGVHAFKIDSVAHYKKEITIEAVT